MKEMKYSPLRSNEVLHEDEYLDYKFAIVNRGTHPTAYVECKIKDLKDYYDDRLGSISVHGGFTFYGLPNWPMSCGSDTLFLGWDYGHFGDFVCLGFGLGPMFRDKKWTTQEIYEEVKDVIHQLIQLEEKETKRQHHGKTATN